MRIASEEGDLPQIVKESEFKVGNIYCFVQPNVAAQLTPHNLRFCIESLRGTRMLYSLASGRFQQEVGPQMMASYIDVTNEFELRRTNEQS